MATQNIVIIINGSASTAIAFSPVQQSWTAPVRKDTVMGSFAVEPTGWSGTIILSGDNAADFGLNQVSGETQLAAARDLTAGTYNLIATSAP